MFWRNTTTGITVPRLVAQLRGFGLAISKRQVMRLLIDTQDQFLGEAREVLRAGLSSAAWITVDDTVARHKGVPKGVNGFCTQIGSAHFAWFGTTGSQSRRNFLELLRAGSRGLRDQCRGAGLYARASSRRAGNRSARQPC